MYNKEGEEEKRGKSKEEEKHDGERLRTRSDINHYQSTGETSSIKILESANHNTNLIQNYNP